MKKLIVRIINYYRKWKRIREINKIIKKSNNRRFIYH